MQTISKQQYYLGADLGRERDYSALCLIDAHLLTKDERDPCTFNWITEWRFHVVHLERIPLGNSYVDVASYISDLLHQYPLARNSHLVFDATGGGLTFYDLLRTKIIPAKLRAVTFTGTGDPRQDGDRWWIPKSLLLAHLHTLFATGHLHISSHLPLADRLLGELSSLQLRFTSSGHDTYEPDSSSKHDDLAMATALAAFFPVHSNSSIFPRLKGFHPNLGPSP
ncbi:MAG: hypothetical protein IT168_08600 [Bryobacterales bacterium]|nr:hypothetical protein [Bryobacterales bacterium]